MGNDIQEAVRILAGSNNNERVFAVDCEVVSIDDDERTCQVRAIGGKARNVFTARLMASVDDGFYLRPEEESTVSVIFGDFTTPYVAQYSGVTKIVLRGGDLGGLVKVLSTIDRLNLIEDKLNALLGKFNAHVHTGVTSGSSSSGPTPQQETGTLVKTVREDIENENITQG